MDGQWGDATVNKEVPMSLSLGLQQDLARLRSDELERRARHRQAPGGRLRSSRHGLRHLVRQVPAHLQRAFGVARPARRTGATGGAVS